MPAPVLISASDALDANQTGPFLIGSNLYTMVQVYGSGSCSIFKSTDSGATWSEKDLVGAPGNGNNAFTCCTDGTTIYVVFVDATTWLTQVATFNTLSDTWTSLVVTTNDGFGLGPTAARVAFRSSDASLVIFAPVDAFTPIGPGSGQRLGFFLFDTVGSTFGVWIACGSTSGADGRAWQMHSLLQGTGSVWWFVMIDEPAFGSGGLTTTLVIQSLTGSVVGSLVNVDSSGDANSFWIPGYSDGTTFVVAWQPAFDTAPQTLMVWKGTTASLPTLASQSVSVAGGGSFINEWSLSASTGLIALLLNASSGGSFPLLQYLDSGAGFGAPTTILVDDDVNSSIQGTVSASSPFWGLVFRDGAGVFFLASSSAPPIPVPSVMIASGGLMVAALPGIGAVCKFARPRRLISQPPRVMLSGKEFVRVP